MSGFGLAIREYPFKLFFLDKTKRVISVVQSNLFTNSYFTIPAVKVLNNCYSVASADFIDFTNVLINPKCDFRHIEISRDPLHVIFI